MSSSKRFLDWLAKLVGTVTAHEPPASNPETLPWWHPRMGPKKWGEMHPGVPLPWREFMDKQEWDSLYKSCQDCECWKDRLCQSCQGSGMVAIPAEKSEWVNRPDEGEGKMSKNGLIEMSFNSYDRYRAAEDKLRSLGYEYTGEGLWSEAGTKQCGVPDLEYSAIGDKSEPNGPTVRDGLIQDFEYRLAKLEHALGEERLARQLGEARIRSLIRIDARMR